MDDFDRAAQYEETERQLAIRNHVSRVRKEPRDYCEDCGEDLAEHRREYGTCIECQTAREFREKHHRRN